MMTVADGTGEGLELGRLEPVDARAVWPHEAHNFTPWLLANADRIGEVLRMDLELSAAEHPVGGFSLDLIGVDQASGERVIIENQLTTTDHLHLGQLLTYAGGTNAVNLVWIATAFREEHRAALDWPRAGASRPGRSRTSASGPCCSVSSTRASSPGPVRGEG